MRSVIVTRGCAIAATACRNVSGWTDGRDEGGSSVRRWGAEAGRLVAPFHTVRSTEKLQSQPWTQAYASDTIRGGAAPLPISVDLAGVKAITLAVEFADRGDELDHADWLSARLVE